MNPRILIVEDDHDIARLVQLHLEDLGCRVEHAADGTSGLRRVENDGFDLVILDLMLPGVDGLEICRRVRARRDYTPVLMLTARSSGTDRVVGLEMGADDYLVKPFDVPELVARVKAILRRVEALRAEAADRTPHPLRHGAIVVDPGRRTASVDGRPVELTAREFDLLAHFVRHPGQVFSRAQLLDRVWGYGHGGYEHTVNTHINRLRAKIEPDPSKPALIRTVWGVGYKLAERAEE